MTLGIVFEQQLFYDKVNNLKAQIQTVQEIMQLSHNEKDPQLKLITFNAKKTQLLQKIEQLQTVDRYNYIERYLLSTEGEYLKKIDSLKKSILTFIQLSDQYYQSQEGNMTTLLQHATSLTNTIKDIIIFEGDVNQLKFKFFTYVVIGLFVIIFIATLYFRSLLDKIYKDIAYLAQLNKTEQYPIFTQEADTIALRMNRKNTTQENNPNNIDQVTGINNYRGLLHAYSQKKGLKNSNFTSVTVIEIDNFSKSNRVFPQDVAQAILKKLAYTISLHEQPIDVIARTDYNQFTIVLSRPTKEQTFKDVELMRESIAELKFNIADKGSVQITVSGGHIIKPNNTILEEAIKQAKEILQYAKSQGKNKILQIRDLAHHDIHH
jgi:diguanylate cyclase (GGDEF)-like protein